MKKKNYTLLRLNKRAIFNFKKAQISGGNTGKGCVSIIPIDKTSLQYQDCTVTHDACVTEPRFCGLF